VTGIASNKDTQVVVSFNDKKTIQAVKCYPVHITDNNKEDITETIKMEQGIKKNIFIS
jgi:dihydroorotase